MRNKGLKQYRFGQNPLERRLAEAWEEANTRGEGKDLIEWLMGDGAEPATDVTDRDRLVAATLVQWLGSPVGQSFLSQVLDEP